MHDIGEEQPSTSVKQLTSNGISSSEWTQHTTEDGRTYYYNKVTKVSSWTRPDALKSPEEKEKSTWREYKTSEGKPYYYNTITKITTWAKPDILKEDTLTIKEEKPELIQITPNSEIEKAMEATLLTLDTKVEPIEQKKRAGDTPKKEEDENSYEYNLKKRQVDKFRDLLQDKCNERRINTNMSWEQASKFIQHDPRFRILAKVSEKKQVFNAWKIQRTKDERDERRLAIKKAKDDLENWLFNHPKVKSTMRYQKAEKYFSSEPLWRAVSDSERREIFEDVKKAISKRNEEQKKQLKERNIKELTAILDGTSEIDYRTTWAQAQRILIENPDFAKDVVLQSMDKEDALIVFQKHVKAAEEHYMKDKQNEAMRIKRNERKTREIFMQLLNELNENGLITPTSTWAALYPTLSTDQRFENMLSTTGSTALDLFKFYVEDLKNQFYQDRKIVREILSEKGLEITESVYFDQFQQWINAEIRGKKISTSNMKLCYNSLYDKAIEKHKEIEKESEKKFKRLEASFVQLLQSLSPMIEPDSSWLQIRERIKEAEQFKVIESEELRERIFDYYIRSLREACGHQHNTAVTKKKKEKKKKRKHEEDSDLDDASKSQKKSKRKRKTSGEDASGSRKKKSRKERSQSVSEGEFAEKKK